MTAHAVSVIVPCYNGGRFLDALLASLRAQVFRNFEIVIVDDGSTEQETRDKLGSLDPSIRVVRQENRGLAGARNTGFREAQAGLVLPLDCDDTIEPEFLVELVGALDRAPSDVGFAFTHMRLTGMRSGVRRTHFDRFDQLFLNYLPYCMLMRKSAWEKAGGYDETMRDGYEDWDFSIRLAAAGCRGVEIPKPLFVYSESSDGMLRRHSVRIHGTLWRRIRTQHAATYRLPALVALLRSRPAAPGNASASWSWALLFLAKILPEWLFNWLFVRGLEVVQQRRSLRASGT